MGKFDFSFVVRFIPKIVTYLIVGFVVGAVIGYVLFFANKDLYLLILTTWFKRILFGAKFLDNQYVLWFVINNLTAMLLAIVGGVLLIITIGRRRSSKYSNRFQNYEKYHPKMTLASLYMIPIGAIFVNAFLISFFLMYVYLAQGYDRFVVGAIALTPNGINEVLALVLATSLGMSYVKVLEPFILKRKWDEAIKVGKRLVFSKTSFYFFVLIAILIVFSAFLEGIDIFQLSR